MKALIASALIVTSVPVLAAAASDDEGAKSQRERRVCTRIERQSGSRLSYTRVCLTASEWRDRLGPDWRQRLAGNTPEDDFDAVDVRTRVFSDLPKPPT